MASQQFGANVIVANEYTLTGSQSLYNQLTVGVSAVAMRIGGSDLLGRTTLTIQSASANTGKIFLGYDNTVTATKTFYELTPGSALTLTISTSSPVSIWAISDTASQKVNVSEGKAL